MPFALGKLPLLSHIQEAAAVVPVGCSEMSAQVVMDGVAQHDLDGAQGAEQRFGQRNIPVIVRQHVQVAAGNAIAL